MRRWEQRTEHLQALIDAQTDIRRRDEWAIRARLVDALLASARRAGARSAHRGSVSTTRSTTARCSGPPAAMAYLPDEDLPF